MLLRRSHLTLIVASGIALACADRSPTAPQAGPESADQVAAAKAGRPGRPGARLVGSVDETINGTAIAGTVRITRLQQDPTTGRLTALGVLTGTANGQAFTQAFGPVLATLTKGGSSAAIVQSSGTTASQLGSCDVLLLDLGPLHLDLLGLEVDLSQVILDIDAQAGAGNLLGNLLCAVVSLLDGPGLLSSIAGILDQINEILSAF